MVCYHPITAYIPSCPDSNDKRRLIFSPFKIDKLIYHSDLGKSLLLNGENPSVYYNNKIIVSSDFTFNGDVKGYLIKVPCGKCLGCRLDYSRRWAVRSYHEAYMHNHFKNCAFLTLTFNNEMLRQRNNPLSVDKVAFSSWMKRLRESIRRDYHIDGVRFFACGEYGSLKGRPHYHVLIYGFNFPDKYCMYGDRYPRSLRARKVGDRILKYYRSPFLEKVWSPAGSDKSFGFSTISDVTFESSAYVARYMLKKVGSQGYGFKEKEFNLTSRMPGLGYSFLEKYYQDMFNIGYVDLGQGRKSDIPRYYVDKLKDIDLDCYNRYKLDKNHFMINNLFIENPDSTEERLLAREELRKMNLDKLVRQYEFDVDLHNIY